MAGLEPDLNAATEDSLKENCPTQEASVSPGEVGNNIWQSHNQIPGLPARNPDRLRHRFYHRHSASVAEAALETNDETYYSSRPEEQYHSNPLPGQHGHRHHRFSLSGISVNLPIRLRSPSSSSTTLAASYNTSYHCGGVVESLAASTINTTNNILCNQFSHLNHYPATQSLSPSSPFTSSSPPYNQAHFQTRGK